MNKETYCTVLGVKYKLVVDDYPYVDGAYCVEVFRMRIDDEEGTEQGYSSKPTSAFAYDPRSELSLVKQFSSRANEVQPDEN